MNRDIVSALKGLVCGFVPYFLFNALLSNTKTLVNLPVITTVLVAVSALLLGFVAGRLQRRRRLRLVAVSFLCFCVVLFSMLVAPPSALPVVESLKVFPQMLKYGALMGYPFLLLGMLVLERWTRAQTSKS